MDSWVGRFVIRRIAPRLSKASELRSSKDLGAARVEAFMYYRNPEYQRAKMYLPCEFPRDE